MRDRNKTREATIFRRSLPAIAAPSIGISRRLLGRTFVALVAATACVGSATCLQALPADPGPAARVNGVPIERQELRQVVKGLARAEPSPPDSVRVDELTRAALESLIDLELLYQEAVHRRIELRDGEVDGEVAKLHRHFDSEEKFAEALASQGMTPQTLRLDTRRTLMAQRVLESTVWRDLVVSAAEVDEFFEENRQALSRPLVELHDSIARMLLDEKKARLRSELLDKLRRNASIERGAPFGDRPTASETRAPERPLMSRGEEGGSAEPQ